MAADSAGASCGFRTQRELARAVRQVSTKSANAVGVHVYPEPFLQRHQGIGMRRGAAMDNGANNGADGVVRDAARAKAEKAAALVAKRVAQRPTAPAAPLCKHTAG